MNPHWNRRIIRLLQIAVTVGGLSLIFRLVDLKTIPSLIWSADLIHVFIAMVIALAHFAVGAWRWQQLIYLTSNRHVSLKLLFNSYLISFSVSSILPGTITGDFIRIFDTRSEAGGSAKAASIIFTERLLGLMILCVLGVSAWISLDHHPEYSVNLPDGLLPLVTLAVMAIIIIWWIYRKKSKAINKLHQWLKLMLTTMIDFPNLVFQKPLGFFRVLAGTFLYQLFALLIVYEGMQAAHVPISLGLFLVIAPMVTMVIMLPISVQGIGVRESLYISLLAPYGASAGAVLAGLALSYLFGLPFILWGWWLYSQRARMAVRNTRLNGSI